MNGPNPSQDVLKLRWAPSPPGPKIGSAGIREVANPVSNRVIIKQARAFLSKACPPGKCESETICAGVFCACSNFGALYPNTPRRFTLYQPLTLSGAVANMNGTVAMKIPDYRDGTQPRKGAVLMIRI